MELYGLKYIKIKKKYKMDSSLFTTPGNHHNNTYLVLLSIAFSIFAKITPANLAVIASVIAIIGGTMAIINYIIIFYDRFSKKKKK